jgi:hypothetical protein
MIARLVTLLPDPDSPTTPRVSPRRRVNERFETAWTTPSRVLKRTVRLRTSRSIDVLDAAVDT